MAISEKAGVVSASLVGGSCSRTQLSGTTKALLMVYLQRQVLRSKARKILDGLKATSMFGKAYAAAAVIG